ncbi:MAG TPA: helix-turn-helix domain-containing protein [Caulobacteraceae bacterium]
MHLSARKLQPTTKLVARCAEGDELSAQLNRRRRELGLTLEQAAPLIGVRIHTLSLWERGLREPFDRYYPALIRFLGEEPWPKAVTLPERLLAERRRRGLSHEPAARLIGVLERTLRRLEAGEIEPSEPVRAKLDRFLG